MIILLSGGESAVQYTLSPRKLDDTTSNVVPIYQCGAADAWSLGISHSSSCFDECSTL